MHRATADETAGAVAASAGGSVSRRWVALAALSLSVFVVCLDATVLDLAVPSMTSALAPTSTQLLWIIDVYSFIVAALLITMGTVGDRIGRRRLLMIGSAAFGLASALAAFAPNAEVLIATRVVQGIAGATLMPSTLALIRSTFPDERERSTAIGVWGATAGAGMALGPLLGGWLLEHFWWGSVFIINVPVMAVLVLVGPFVIRESRDPAPGRFDLLGVGLSIVGVGGLVYALKETFAHGPAPANAAIALLAAAAAGWFLRRQRGEQAMIQLELFRRPSFSAAISATLLAMFAISGILFFGSQYLQLVLGYGALVAGLLTLPGMVMNVCAAMAAGMLARRFGVRAVFSWGMGLAASGALCMLTTDVSGSPVLFVVGYTLLAGSVGGITTLASDVVVSEAPPERAGAAAALSEAAYELGIALGVAVLGGIVTWAYRARLDTAGLAPEQARHASDTIGGALTVAHELGSAGEALAASARDAFIQGMHIAALGTALCFVASALLTVWMIPRR